jgi:hypothetical protein
MTSVTSYELASLVGLMLEVNAMEQASRLALQRRHTVLGYGTAFVGIKPPAS